MAKLLLADASKLALPPLAPDEAVRPAGQRDTLLVPAALPSFGPGFNLFGTHDIRGRGTHIEPSPHCDPFLMCVAAVMPAGAKLPFCAHPHCGASIASILLQGTAVRPWDNLRGPEEQVLLPGGIYHVDTGAGCVHDEPIEPLNLRPATRPGFRDDEPPSLPCPPEDTRTMLMQLWWNGIDMAAAAGTPLRPVRTQIVQPADVPRIEQADGLAIRCLSGSYLGRPDPLARSVTHPVILLHVRLAAGADGELAQLPADFNGFAWILSGAAELGGAEGRAAVRAEHGERGLVFLPPGGDRLRVRNCSAEAPALLFVALGRPHRKPYYKYVGYGGGLIHRSVAEVEAAMAEYESDPKHFGRSAAEAVAKPVDFERFKLVGGFESDDGDMMERPAHAIARLAYA
jgi:redox-sensitive bicupin YhaK (pirin superfamily)